MKAIWPLLVAAISLASVSAVNAKTWPAKPLRAIVPFGAGSTTDIIPRVVFEQLSSQLGQAIIVETAAAREDRSVPGKSRSTLR